MTEDGKRTPVEKVDGAWQRSDTRGAEPSARSRDDAQQATSTTPQTVATVPAESVIAKIDAEAERAARTRQLEAALRERYIIKRAPLDLGAVTLGQTEYRYRGDTSRVAFTESTFKLSTDNNNPSVARSMVDVAEARNWRALRVSGNEDFKRLVWLEASLRGVKTLGHEPQQADQELLRRERDARAVNRIEPAPASREGSEAAAAVRPSARGSGGRKAVLAALEAVLVAKRVPEKQREAVMAAAAENLAQRLREGQTLKVKVFDKAAPSQRPAIVPTPEAQRSRERAAPVR